MATAMTPPTPPSLAFQRLHSHSHSHSASPSLQRHASTASSHSTATSESTSSSLVAVPIRPPPIQTRTAATLDVQLPHDSAPHAPSPSPSLPSPRPSRYDDESQGLYGGRGFMRNGPRMARQNTAPPLPAIITTLDARPDNAEHAPDPEDPTAAQQEHDAHLSPSTPRPSRRLPLPAEPSPTQPRVTISLDTIAAPGPGPSSARGRPGSTPGSPITHRYDKQRTLSVDAAGDGRAGQTERERERERRQSQASIASAGSRRPSIRDYVVGEELGRGSYSTVVRATLAPNNAIAASPRGTRRFAIKIMNQAHLVAERKIKYAHIERDALIRLSAPREKSSPTVRTHRRGMSSSSSAGYANPGAAKRKSNTSLASTGTAGQRRNSATNSQASTPVAPGRERLSVQTVVGETGASPVSPIIGMGHGRRPSRGAEPPDSVDERAELAQVRSRPPSPVQEESESALSTSLPRSPARINDPRRSPVAMSPVEERCKTPGKRRQSLAPSERSVKSSTGGGSAAGVGHPGIIRLYCTFADKTSVYYVLDLAANGELAAAIRKYGSLDVNSARYYAAQLIDTIEFMHEREIIHRDLKPENILLDDDMRIKVTDFGSAKIVGGDKPDDAEGSKRSFVGSADYVSPEVLRSEPATYASDIWAFGVIIYDFITGKSPFRSATEYLTFQKVLARQLTFPDEFDADARDLVEQLLNLDPTQRPGPEQIKAHPFFASIDWASLWTAPAPHVESGLSPPVKTLANVDLRDDVWAVFDDEVSDGGFEYDDAEGEEDAPGRRTYEPEPVYDALQARNAVEAHDHPGVQFPTRETTPGQAATDATTDRRGRGGPGFDPAHDLGLPRRAWLDDAGSGAVGAKDKGARKWSTSSSGSGKLSGLLESIRIGNGYRDHSHGSSRDGSDAAHAHTHSHAHAHPHPQTHLAGGRKDARVSPTRSSRLSDPADGDWTRVGRANTPDGDKWAPILLVNERVILSTPISTRPSTAAHLPSFLLPQPKRRQLVLTDFPRLVTVKDDDATGALRVKTECVFLARGSGTGSAGGGSVTDKGVGRNGSWGRKRGARDTPDIPDDEGAGEKAASASSPAGSGSGSGAANCVLDVQEKGSRAFTVQTISQTYHFVADTPDVRLAWVSALKKFVP
ncbi:serine/threonine protein kinase [Cryptotrichosporon argae]